MIDGGRLAIETANVDFDDGEESLDLAPGG